MMSHTEQSGSHQRDEIGRALGEMSSLLKELVKQNNSKDAQKSALIAATAPQPSTPRREEPKNNNHLQEQHPTMDQTQYNRFSDNANRNTRPPAQNANYYNPPFSAPQERYAPGYSWRSYQGGQPPYQNHNNGHQRPPTPDMDWRKKFNFVNGIFLCFYHHRFGVDAKRCEEGCQWRKKSSSNPSSQQGNC
jgi:hypothetical protein